VTASQAGGPRLALNGHLDVVPEGSAAWRHGGPWSGAVDDGVVWGRGSVWGFSAAG
jgi:acetylornithine deacetylase/succinyl-diaminopimelate desuccinylase-like protein